MEKHRNRVNDFTRILNQFNNSEFNAKKVSWSCGTHGAWVALNINIQRATNVNNNNRGGFHQPVQVNRNNPPPMRNYNYNQVVPAPRPQPMYVQPVIQQPIIQPVIQPQMMPMMMQPVGQPGMNNINPPMNVPNGPQIGNFNPNNSGVEIQNIHVAQPTGPQFAKPGNFNPV